MAQKTFTLSEQLEGFIEAEVRSGRFATVDEVVQHALSEFRKLQSLREDFREARAEFARGEGIELTADGLLAHLKGHRPEGFPTSSH
jgi:putative addiction module CopG family antidote